MASNLFCCVIRGKKLYFLYGISVIGGIKVKRKKKLSAGIENFKEFRSENLYDVKEILLYYGLESFYDTVKEWYDGYRFGNVSVYCPWDMINYCYALLADRTAPPEDYWSNTSSNSIVRRFIDKADKGTKNEIMRLSV